MNLLTRIATTIGLKRGEDVASGALAYLLDSYPPIRAAFLELVDAVAGVSVNPDLHFVVQQYELLGGVTDISGAVGGVEEMIVEAKIGAGLHHGQVEKYLGRLGGPAPVLVVLTPDVRLRAVFADAVRQAGATVAGNHLCATCGTTTLVGLSWEEVAGSIEAAAESSDAAAAGEVHQVVGLYRYLESRVFLPLSGADVAMANGRLVRSLEKACNATLGKLSTETGGHVVVRDSTRHHSSAFGRNVTVSGLNAWFGVWPAMWAEHADTPFWLQLYGPDSETCVRAQAALDDLDPLGRPSAWRHSEWSLVVAIYPLFGVDLDDVGADMAATVAEAARRLIAAIGTAPVTGADAPPSLQVELMPEVLDNLGDMDLLGAQEPAPGDAMPPSAPA